MLELEALRKTKHERKRRNEPRSRSQTGGISRRECSTGKFGNFEIISYAPMPQKQSSIVQLAIGRSTSRSENHVGPSSTSCILNANSNHRLVSENTNANPAKQLSSSESTLAFIRNSKLRSSPYRSKSTMSRDKEHKKTEKVFLSEKHTKSIKECGSSMPGAPPATPTPCKSEKLSKFWANSSFCSLTKGLLNHS